MRILRLKLRLACAFKARAICNGVFVSGIDARRLSREDAAFNPFFKLAFPRIDRRRRSVSCSILGTGLFRETAMFVDGIGAVLLAGVAEESVRAWPRVPLADPPAVDVSVVPWPAGDAIIPAAHVRGPDTKKVAATVERLFDDRGRRNKLRTRAVLVVYDGRLICERYAPGFGPNMRMLSWSMAKSVVSVLVGILAGQGKLAVDEPAPVPEWSDPRDPRHAITPSQLLRMSAGLAWTETYGEQPISDVNRMLFLEPDMARFAASRPLAEEPDSTFFYASGSTNILCRMMRGLFASAGEYLSFPHRELFDPDRHAQRGVGYRRLRDDRGIVVPVRHRPRLRAVRHVLPGRWGVAGRAHTPRGLDGVGNNADAGRSERRVRGGFLAQPRPR